MPRRAHPLRRPCAGGVPAQAAALSSFIVSGLFHEYAFLPANGVATLGGARAFLLAVIPEPRL